MLEIHSVHWQSVTTGTYVGTTFWILTVRFQIYNCLENRILDVDREQEQEAVVGSNKCDCRQPWWGLLSGPHQHRGHKRTARTLEPLVTHHHQVNSHQVDIDVQIRIVIRHPTAIQNVSRTDRKWAESALLSALARGKPLLSHPLMRWSIEVYGADSHENVAIWDSELSLFISSDIPLS